MTSSSEPFWMQGPPHRLGYPTDEAYEEARLAWSLRKLQHYARFKDSPCDGVRAAARAGMSFAGHDALDFAPIKVSN